MSIGEPSPTKDNSLRRLSALRASLERSSFDAEERKRGLQGLEVWERKRAAEDRSKLTRQIILFYFGCVAFIALAITLRSYVVGSFDDYFVNLFDLLKVAVLPVVTFVLGYYFSRK